MILRRVAIHRVARGVPRTCTGVVLPCPPSLDAWPAIAAADDRSATLPLALPSDAETPLLRLLEHACAHRELHVIPMPALHIAFAPSPLA